MAVVLLITVESECVGCPDDMGCIYELCPYYEVVRYYCDECGQEDDLYYWNGCELCTTCILKQLERVEYDG